jgi:hypothetical protein
MLCIEMMQNNEFVKLAENTALLRVFQPPFQVHQMDTANTNLDFSIICITSVLFTGSASKQSQVSLVPFSNATDSDSSQRNS